MDAITALKAPFRRFPRTMWSGSALRRTPYLFLSVDSVTFRTFNSYGWWTRWNRKEGNENMCPQKMAHKHLINVIHNNQKVQQSKCLQLWMDKKQGPIRTVDYHLAIQRNEALTHAVPWMSLGAMWKKSDTKTMYYVILFIRNVQRRYSPRQETDSWLLGTVGSWGETGAFKVMDIGFLYENVMKLQWLVAQLYKTIELSGKKKSFLSKSLKIVKHSSNKDNSL